MVNIPGSDFQLLNGALNAAQVSFLELKKSGSASEKREGKRLSDAPSHFHVFTLKIQLFGQNDSKYKIDEKKF